MARGIDVYTRYQTVTNWTAVRNAGYEYVYIKVSDGTSTRSEGGYAKAAQAAGLYAGGYHYAQFGNPVQQANILVDRCEATGATDLAPCLDLEDPFRADQNAVNFTIEFLKQIKRRGYTPCLYANNSMMSYLWPRVKPHVPDTILWVARYASNSSTTPSLRPSVEWDVHQYSHAGQVPGISAGAVDLNDGIIPLNKSKSPDKPKTEPKAHYYEDYPMLLPKGGKLKPGGATKLRWQAVTVPVLEEHDLIIGSVTGVHIETINTWKYIHKGQAEQRWGVSNKLPGGVGALVKDAWVHGNTALSVVVPKGVGVVHIAYASKTPVSVTIAPRK